MNIGIFDPYLDTLGGGEKYILTIATCLAQKHNVAIFWEKSQEAEIRKETKGRFRIDLEAVKFTPNIFNNNVSFLNRLKLSKKYDKIIYLSDGSIPFVWSKLYIHFQFPTEWVNGNTLLTRFKLKRVKKVFCNSLFTKKYIDKKFNINSCLLYPPIIIQKGVASKENIILNVGRFSIDDHGVNYKKQDVIIETFKKMVELGLGNWKLVLIISSLDKDRNKFLKLREMTRGYPIDIIHNSTNEILWNNYAKAKVYWHASGFGEDLEKYPEKAEHFGISTVEAMGKGVVPVVINKGGQKEIVENGKSGFLFNTIDECINYTQKLIKDPQLWSEMSEDAIERSKIFSGNRFCEELKEMMDL